MIRHAAGGLEGQVVSATAFGVVCLLAAACGSSSAVTTPPAKRSTLVLTAASSTGVDLRADQPVILRRLQALGMAPSSVEVGTHTLTIHWNSDVPPSVAKILGELGVLEFRPALGSSPARTPAATVPRTPKDTAKYEAKYTSRCSVPAAPVPADQPAVLPELAGGQILACYSLAASAMTSPGISDASAQQSTTVGQAALGWEVKVDFSPDASGQFDQLAQRYYQRQIAIVCDDVVQSAPTINARSFGGTAVIAGGSSGGFTRQQAEDLTAVLRSGQLSTMLTAGPITH
jgi:preprotein translocase subunit SecD